MPELDYVILADYVRQDAGTIHLMAAGLDTFYIPASALPAMVPVGIAIRIMLSSQDAAGEVHKLSLVFSGPDGELLNLTQHFPAPEPPEGIPPTWRHSVTVAMRLGIPFPAHGVYALQVMLDDDPVRSRRLDYRAVEPAG